MNGTTHHIAEDQNAPYELSLLAAQRRLHSRAKMFYATSALSGVVGALVWVPLALQFPAVKPWVALYGVVMAVLDLCVFEGAQKARQRSAADVQELFDCRLLHLPLHPVRQPSAADPEFIQQMAKSQEQRDPGLASLRDWYPPSVRELPLGLARLVCQRTNLRWDAELRRAYALGLLTALVVIVLGVLVIGLAAGLGVATTLLVLVAPLLPAVVWMAREFRRQRDAATAGDSAKSRVESIWNSALMTTPNDEALVRWARAIQDEIYARRRGEPPVFDWVYRLLKVRYEQYAAAGVEDFVRRVREIDPAPRTTG